MLEAVKSLPGVMQLRRLRYGRFFRSAENVNLFSGVYPTLAALAAELPRSKPTGYDAAEPAGMYRDHLGTLAPRDYPQLFWLSKILRGGQRLLDFGGHFGIKYYNFREHLDLTTTAWTVYDLPAVVASGRRFARERGERGIDFVDSVDGVVTDVFYACGSLQYLPGPVSETLGKLGARPRHVIVANLPVHEELGFYTIQNIGTAFCPYQIFARAALIEDMAELGYELVDDCPALEKACHIPFHPRHSLRSYWSFHFRLRDGATGAAILH